MQPLWKKPQARAALVLIAQDVAEFFAVPAPAVYVPDWHSGKDWEWRFATSEVWTKADRAELNVTLSARFAHMYFRFDDTARAAVAFNDGGRLNRFSGKWNAISTPDTWTQNGNPSPETSIDCFRAELRRDFRRVAEPNPPSEEVAAYRAKEAERAARWASLGAPAC